MTGLKPRGIAESLAEIACKIGEDSPKKRFEAVFMLGSICGQLDLFAVEQEKAKTKVSEPTTITSEPAP
jgi:hypothetical protein